MFSKMIQNLLSSSGKSAAMQRYAALNAQIDGFKNKIYGNNQNLNPMDTIYPQNRASSNDPNSFENILKSSIPTTEFGNLLLGSQGMKVNASLLKNQQTQTLTNAIQELSSANNNISELNSGSINSKAQILDMVTMISDKYGVDDRLVKALIRQESGFNPNAKSKVGAMGLMQLMPATAKSLGVQNAFNPVQNVDGGVRYLKSMLERYNGNIILALAAYNAGPGAVDKYSGVPPYQETQNYVKNILANYL